MTRYLQVTEEERQGLGVTRYLKAIVKDRQGSGSKADILSPQGQPCFLAREIRRPSLGTEVTLNLNPFNDQLFGGTGVKHLTSHCTN